MVNSCIVLRFCIARGRLPVDVAGRDKAAAAGVQGRLADWRRGELLELVMSATTPLLSSPSLSVCVLLPALGNTA